MALIFDSDVLPVADRAEAFVEAMEHTSWSDSVVPDTSQSIPSARMRFTETGQGSLFTSRSTPTRISLSTQKAMGADQSWLAVAIQLEGNVLRRSPTGERLERPGDVFIVDHRGGFDVRWEDISHTAAFRIPRETLGLTLEEESVAASLVRGSPLYPLLRRHLAELARLPDVILEGLVRTEIDEATVRLVRALLASTKGESQFTREVSGSTMFSLVQTYIHQNIREPDLSAARVAGALNISTRTVYRLFAGREMSLEQYVIFERLNAARFELEAGSQLTTIASIAYQFAFKDAQHFSRRFKAQFGMSPHEFRAQFGPNQPQ